ncbi:MAG: carboxypeptidase-like regulatory domain-containing protein [Pyrinomonadaceae bacterium MAG19_C2-C3]|nr:carboxypeptidase-like regulatory domain-containing protein [Pyrinomonadaceae bacterium MAG19_C2-C3]
MKKFASILALVCFALLTGVSVQAQTFQSGNIVIYRIGPSTATGGTLSSAAQPVFLDEYTQTGTFVRTIALPTVVDGNNRRLTANGTTSTEGLLTRSADGRFLVLTGYDAELNSTNPANVSGATVNRVVGRVNAAGTVDTSTTLSDASGNIRGAATADGSSIYVTTSGSGVRFVPFGNPSATTTTLLSAAPTNTRAVGIFSSPGSTTPAQQLYITSQSSGIRIGTVGSGLPTTSGQTITNLNGTDIQPVLGGANGTTRQDSPYGFFFADLSSSVAGVDTLYIADDSGTLGGIQKFSLVGGNFVSNGTINQTSADGGATMTAFTSPRSVTGFVTIGGAATAVTLFATTGGTSGTGGGTLVRILDTSGYNAAPSTTVAITIATAATNTTFRGVALAPLNPTADTVTIEGRATTANGAPLSGVTLRLAGTQQSVTMTDADGHYRFEGVEVGGIYTVSASHRGYRFAVSRRTFGDVQTNTVADFIAAPIKKRSLRSRF